MEQPTVKPAVDLTDDEILQSTKYELVCPACGGRKFLGEALCRTDYHKLPYGLRQSLHRAFHNGFEKAFRGAIENLRQIGVRNPYEQHEQREQQVTDRAAG